MTGGATLTDVTVAGYLLLCVGVPLAAVGLTVVIFLLTEKKEPRR